MGYFDVNKYTVYTADNEEPKYINCDKCDTCSGDNCGPHFGWTRYFRLEERSNDE